MDSASPHAAAANAARNLSRVWRRRIDWRPARHSLWSLLDRHLPTGATVAIVGVGSGDDVPLRRICRRAARVDLIDIDPRALRRARRRTIAAGARVATIVEDVTRGDCDVVVARATGARPGVAPAPVTAIGNGPYDVVIGDLLYTQLVHPALVDAGLPRAEVDRLMLRHGQRVTDAVVARLHASAPDGVVVHLHDLLGWWPGNQQRFAIDDVLQLPPTQALALATTGSLPYGCDPRAAAVRAGARIDETAFWRWNFGAGKQFLVCATVAASAPGLHTG